MVHRSLDNLQLDRRLLMRQGWISEEELAKELEALPDVADKVAPPEEETPPEEASATLPDSDQGGGSL